MSGGAIYLQGESSAKIENTQFIDNVATKKGGAIFAESFNTLTITGATGTSTFIRNDAIDETGDAIHVLDTQSKVDISNSYFYSNKSTQFIEAGSIT